MRVALTIALCCLGVAWAADAQALTGAAAVAALNAQRTASGIPGDLVERADWTAACAAHNRYQKLNGIFDTSEDPARRGYSKPGDWAAHNAALARDVWTASHNPWQNTPLALMALLSPRLTQLGASTSYQHVCATTFPGYLRAAPPAPSLYPYPGDGATGVPFATWSFGAPFTPGDFVGLPAGYTTGPNLLVMADIGGQATLEAASLVGPGGPVELRTVDNTEDRIGALMPTGAILIPARPLAPGATYQAAVTLAVSGRTLTRAWSFSTAPADPHTILFVSSALSFDRST